MYVHTHPHTSTQYTRTLSLFNTQTHTHTISLSFTQRHTLFHKLHTYKHAHTLTLLNYTHTHKTYILLSFSLSNTLSIMERKKVNAHKLFVERVVLWKSAHSSHISFHFFLLLTMLQPLFRSDMRYRQREKLIFKNWNFCMKCFSLVQIVKWIVLLICCT